MAINKRLVAEILIGALLLGLFVYVERKDAADKATLQATLNQQNAIIDQLNKSIATRDAQAVTEKRAVDKKVAAAKTPVQQAVLLSDLLGLRKPIFLSSDMQIAALPAEELPQVVEHEATCKKDQIDLQTCRGDLIDREAQIAAFRKERDTAVTIAKGGSRWQGFKRGAKWVGVGILTGIAVDEVMRRK
jgi:hypothetical protein